MPIIKLAALLAGTAAPDGERKKRIIFNYLARTECIVVYLLNFAAFCLTIEEKSSCLRCVAGSQGFTGTVFGEN